MHREYRNTHVDSINIKVSDICSNSSAAAGIYLAELTGLPDDFPAVHETSYASCKLCGSVRSAGFSACAGIFCNANALIDICAVVTLVDLGISWVECSVNVRRKALGSGENVPSLSAERLSEVMDKILEVRRAQTRIAVAAGLLLVCEDRYCGMNRSIAVESCSESGI